MMLSKTDKTVYDLINKEIKRQSEQLQMIPSENYAPKAVREAVGSVVMNKYSEGQPAKRYYQGNQFIDEIELEAHKRALELFKLDSKKWGINVQAANGSTANLAVYMGLLEPGDKMLGMYLYDGGHLSHGWKLPSGQPVSMTSKLYDSHFYSVDKNTEVLNYDEIEKIAKKVKPKIIISGGTAYPIEINYKRMGEIAKSVGAYYLADVAHEAGLIAGGANKSPFNYADIVTMTTRKTLRGPVGAIIFAKKELISDINRAVFPGLQGGPMNHSIAGIAVTLKLAQTNSFKKYAIDTVNNCKVLATELKKQGFKLVSNGTEKHLLLIDLTKRNIDGWCAAWALEYAGIICNRSTVPYDSRSPYYPSGLRFGTPALTTREMGNTEMIKIAKWINEVIQIGEIEATKYLEDFDSTDKKTRLTARMNFKNSMKGSKKLNSIAQEIKQLCKKFPIPN